MEALYSWSRLGATAVVALLLLAGCGGSDSSHGSAAEVFRRAPAKEDTALLGYREAKPPQAATVAQTREAAERLFNWAEARYPQHFPSNRRTQEDAPYLYRYYPESQNYVGVSGDGVYVLGPVSDGALAYVGSFSGFQCIANPELCAPADIGIELATGSREMDSTPEPLWKQGVLSGTARQSRLPQGSARIPYAAQTADGCGLSSANCGQTVVAMAVAGLNPASLDPAACVAADLGGDRLPARCVSRMQTIFNSARGYPSCGAATSAAELAQMARAQGLRSYQLTPEALAGTQDRLDTADFAARVSSELGNGCVVAMNLRVQPPTNAKRGEMLYGDFVNNPAATGGHWILLTGETSSAYLVNDPFDQQDSDDRMAPGRPYSKRSVMDTLAWTYAGRPNTVGLLRSVAGNTNLAVAFCAAAENVEEPIRVSVPALVEAVTGSRLSQQLASDKSASAVAWRIASGTLPAGVSLSSAGQLAGTPSQAGTYTATVAATYTRAGATAPHSTAEQRLTIRVTAPQSSVRIFHSGDLGVVGVGKTLVVSLREFVDQAVSWAASSLPSGASVVGETLVLRLTDAGDFAFRLTATATGGTSSPSSKDFRVKSVQMNQAALPAPAITALSPNAVTVSAAPQVISLAGTGFRAGANVSIVQDGGITVSSSLLRLQTTQIQVSALLDRTGTFSVEVLNPDGQRSNRLSLSTRATGPVVPAAPATLNPGTAGAPGPLVTGAATQLSWAAVAGATYYSVAVRNVATGALVVDTTVTSNSYSPSFASNTQFRWNVAACNTAGCSSYSAAMYFQTPAGLTAPAAPSLTSPGNATSPGPAVDAGGVVLSWSTVPGATYYSVGVRDVVTGALVVDATSGVGYHIVTLPAGSRYRWNVAACNSAGCSSFSAVWYFQTSASAPRTPLQSSPGSPANSLPIIGTGPIQFSWSAVEGATYYSLGVRNAITGALVIDTTTSSNSYSANLAIGSQYRWNVAACNATGCSVFSGLWYFQTQSPTAVPAVPSGTPGTAAAPGPNMGTGAVQLNWFVVPTSTYYSIAIRDMGTGGLVVDTTTTSTAYSATLPAGQYRWNVAACNAAGCSNFSSALYFQTQATVTPPTTVPTWLTVGSTSAPGPNIGSGPAQLGWSSSSGATYYSVGVRDMATGALVVDTTTASTFLMQSLPSGQYRWNVAACNTAGCSSFSTAMYFQIATVTAPTTSPTPSSPGSPSSPGTSISAGSVQLSWAPVSGATYYSLGVRNITTNVLVVDTNPSSNSYVANLAGGSQYRWNVAACNAAGCSSYSSLMYFQTR